MTAPGHTAQFQSWSRQHRSRPGAGACVPLGVLVLAILFSFLMGAEMRAWWEWAQCPVEAPAAIHTITPESVSAQEIAGQYGWRGDWRDYMEQMRRLNGWQSWPILHAGEKIIVPDCRKQGGRAVGRGRRTPPIANQALLDRTARPPT